MGYKNIIGKQIHFFDIVDSTNSVAKEMYLKEQIDEGAVIVAHFQKSGKGLEFNTWESESGKNLTASFLLCPKYLNPKNQFLLNKLVPLAIVDFLKEILIKNIHVSIKWPNDIWVNNKKIAGILTNNTIQGNHIEFSVVGIGLNVNQTHFYSNAPNPISLKMITKKEYEICTVLYRLCDFLNRRLREFFNDPHKIDKEYLQHLYRFKIFEKYILKENKIEAKITGVNEFGKLLLENKQGMIYECDVKEIKFII